MLGRQAMSDLIYQLLFLFFIYAFLGWCVEVVFHVVTCGRFINRGFLNGPVCPIYGFGMVGVVFCLEPLEGNLLLLFAASLVLTSFLELITGFVLEQLFHARWWDYSQEPFHIGPYVCLKFSLMWGFACVFVVRILHPSILLLVGVLPRLLGITLLSIFSAVILTDLIATVHTVHAILRRLAALDEIAAEIRSISDRIGEKLTDSTMTALEKERENRERLEALRSQLDGHLAEHQEQLQLRLTEYREQLDQHLDELENRRDERREAHQARLEDIRQDFRQRLAENPFGHRRILKAFPHLTHKKYQDVLSQLRDSINVK